MKASIILYKLQKSDELVKNKNELFNEMISIIKEFNMSSFYEYSMKKLNKPIDSSLLKQMSDFNDKKNKELDDKVEKEKEYMGESDLIDVKLDKLREYNRACNIEAFDELFNSIEPKQITLHQKIEIYMDKMWLYVFYYKYVDFAGVLKEIEELINEGGDWDQRNRMKVYQAIEYLIESKPVDAAPLLLDCLPVFTSFDVLEYDKYIFYTIICSILSLERTELYKRVVTCPDILSSTSQNPLSDLLITSFYNCKYDEFMKCLLQLYVEFSTDPLLSPHTNYFIKELRIKAYNQYLLSYQRYIYYIINSCTLKSMADAFGVSVPFLDKELARFIASNRIIAKIDMVDGVVKSCRPNTKNSKYINLLTQSDAILARIQGFTRIFNT